MKGFLWRSLVNFCAILIVAALVRWISVDGYGSLFVAAMVLALLNAVIRPVLLMLTLPFNILTLGLFTLVINTLILKMVGALVPGFSTGGFFPTLGAAVLISLLSMIISAVFGDKSA